MATSRISPSRPSIRLSPIHSRQNSRSTSPERNQNSLYQKIDPLLSNLSPESTLHALTSTEAVPSNGNFSHNVLSQSISQVSPAERALGIRAAIAAQNLDIWYKEVQSWTWPKQNEAKAGKGFIPPVESSLRYNTAESDLPLLPGSHGEPEFYGSLPATLVEEYEKRIDEIRDGMDNLNVDELKEHVLSAHIPSRSRPSSSTSTVSVPPPLSYVQLSDFTAIVTATILRALPLLSRLNSLLITWDVRLLVLRQIPGLLRELSSTRASLNSSFRELRSSYPSQSINTILPGSYLRAEHVKLETAVVTVGRRMDRALDALEGRLDSLPESWIDDLESIESDFAAWVVESERYQLRAEWLPVKEQSKQPVLSESGLLQPEVPSEAIDNVPALPQAATEVTPEPQMETIEEETEHDLQSSAIGSVEEVVKTVDSRTHATEKGFDTHTSSSPQCVQGPGYSEQPHRIEDSRPLSQLQFNTLVVEDVQTPTHTDSLLAQEAVVSEQSSATGSLPHAMPVIENKENIPPPSYKQERPRSSSTRDPSSKPMVLAEHNAEDDPFVQTSVEFQAKEPPASSTSVDKLDKHREHTGISSELNNIRDEYVDSKAPITQNSEPSVSSPAVNEMVPAAEMITVHEIAGQESLEKPGLDNVSSRDASSSPSFLDEQDPVTSSTLYTPKESDTMSALSGKTQTIASNAQGDQRIPSSGVINPATSANDQNDCLSQTPAKGHSVANHDPPLQVTSPVVSTESATKTSPNLVHEAAEICPSIPSDFRKSNHMEPDPTPVTIRKAEEKGPEPPTSSRKPLQSPIKLSKGRPGKLDLDKTSHIHHHRRSSTGSVGSLLSDNSSLISSPEIPAFKTGESSGHPPVTPSGPKLSQPVSVPSHGDHMLREDRLLRLNNPARTEFQPNRSVSLPLERFINDKFDLDLEVHTETEVGFPPEFKSSLVPKSSGDSATASTPKVPLRTSSRPRLVRGKSASDLKAGGQPQSTMDRNLKTFGLNTAQRALKHQEQPKSLQLRKRLTAHPSLESLGVRKQELTYVEEDESELFESRAASPNKQYRRPRDQLDEKINSILSTLPGRIHLVDPNNEADTSSSSSSMDQKPRERQSSEPPNLPLSRSMTPAPSLTLMPAARRRLSHAHKTEDSCVKLYHLHHGGQAVPTKLFVRTVGEDGQRVMVRVGGGWADLGEYLREYVIHHGRRKVSETPRVEVKGLASRSSPGYSSPGTMLTPAVSSHITSGRATPSRPPSAMSARPGSALTVRKTRRGSNASDAMVPRSVTTGSLLPSPSQAVPPLSRRRLSISSSYSVGDTHVPAISTIPHLASDSHSTPLGLAGPKPRSRQISMSPEGEAWVEDVLQQTRRSSSFNPSPFALSTGPGSENGEQHDAPSHDHRPVPKVRSISDIRSVSSSRRVSLRGLGNHR